PPPTPTPLREQRRLPLSFTSSEVMDHSSDPRNQPGMIPRDLRCDPTHTEPARNSVARAPLVSQGGGGGRQSCYKAIRANFGPNPYRNHPDPRSSASGPYNAIGGVS